MGSFDGAETCELVGLFLLSQLSHLGMDVELYRVDGLATCAKIPKQGGSVKKQMCKIFKHHNLRITIEANKKAVDFLDLKLDLRTGIFKPYKKSNNKIAYIHKQSNHPPSIIKNPPKGINKRLSTNPNDAQTFKEAIPPEVLKKSRYNTNLQFNSAPTKKSNKNKTTKRKITFNTNVATNVAKIFLSLIEQNLQQEQSVTAASQT